MISEMENEYRIAKAEQEAKVKIAKIPARQKMFEIVDWFSIGIGNTVVAILAAIVVGFIVIGYINSQNQQNLREACFGSGGTIVTKFEKTTRDGQTVRQENPYLECVKP